MPGGVLVEPPFPLAHVRRRPIGFGTDGVRVHRVIAQAGAFRADQAARLGDVRLQRQLLAENAAPFAHVEQGRKAAGVAVLVVGQADLPLALLGLDIVEVSENVVTIQRLDARPLPVIAGRIAVVDGLEVVALRVLVELVLGVGHLAGGNGPGFLPGGGMDVVLFAVAGRGRDRLVGAGAVVLDRQQVGIGLEARIASAGAAGQQPVVGAVVVNDAGVGLRRRARLATDAVGSAGPGRDVAAVGGVYEDLGAKLGPSSGWPALGVQFLDQNGVHAPARRFRGVRMLLLAAVQGEVWGDRLIPR